MRGIVKSRPFVKRTRRGLSSGGTLPFVRGRRRGKDQPSFFSSFFKKWGLIGLIILLTSVLIVFLLRGTRYNPTYLIKTIEYSQETRAKYWNTELFVLASKFLRGKYYNTLRIGGDGKLLERVRQEYPFTKSAHITFLGNQKVKVDFDFYSPEFLVKLWEKKFGVRGNNNAEELNPSRSLGKTGFVIDTPWYLSGTSSLSGFFYEVDFTRYKNNLPKIQEAFPKMKRFVYLAWSQNFVVFEENKMIFLFKEELEHQLQKFARLKGYYSGYNALTTVDLGSLTQDKVIVVG